MGINFIALFVAALIPMALGFLWYSSALFGKAWMQAAGVRAEDLRKNNMAVIFGVSFLLSIIISFAMNMLAYHDSFVSGALFYVTKGTMIPEPGSEAAKWLEYYKANFSDACRTFKHGAFHGAVMGGVCLSLPILGINALFEGKGFKYIAINAGFWIVCLGLMGGIIAAWK